MTQRLSASVIAALAVALLTAAPAVRAEDLKVGVVNSDRILRDSQPARAAMQKLEAEFSKRDKDMQEMGARLKANAERFEKDGPIMSESDRVRRQRELAEADREFQRKQREFREDFNQRRNEELQGLLERTNRIIRQIAEQEKFDLIVQEAVYFNPRIDMTERVLRALNNTK
ncbi:MAG TPA: OmpH family outer membrane protein [Burkholderiaceae bacterium]|jgi:outer membrane protein|nr:OmpH family outer membrane protein [Burkholderiaceae bacterium]